MILESNQRELIFHVRTRSIAQVLQLEQSSRELSRRGGPGAVVGANQGVGGGSQPRGRWWEPTKGFITGALKEPTRNVDPFEFLFFLCFS